MQRLTHYIYTSSYYLYHLLELGSRNYSFWRSLPLFCHLDGGYSGAYSCSRRRCREEGSRGCRRCPSTCSSCGELGCLLVWRDLGISWLGGLCARDRIRRFLRLLVTLRWFQRFFERKRPAFRELRVRPRGDHALQRPLSLFCQPI